MRLFILNFKFIFLKIEQVHDSPKFKIKKLKYKPKKNYHKKKITLQFNPNKYIKIGEQIYDRTHHNFKKASGIIPIQLKTIENVGIENYL